jgi:small subunit ribosomal protein S17
MADETPEETTTDAPAAPAEPVTPLNPKERRQARRLKARARTKARAQMTPEERQADRDAERKRKAAQRQRRRAKEKVARAEHRAANPAQEELHAPEHGPGRPKRLQGIVVSDKADKMVVVRIDEARKHPRYRKVMRTSMKVHVHDETNDAHVGDTVRVVESRPLSRTKRWRLLEVVERAR